MDRYQLPLAIGARTIMRGWWSDLPTAERKYLRWIGERGSVNGEGHPCRRSGWRSRAEVVAAALTQPGCHRCS
ncbi:hypothetical protein ACFU98_45870 [Streptomyces sp. NPDC057575]|uniref:hypothetical protein n=1 Tax=unclassified Streptomyces TaxID=2593676 RepID=UPI0036781B9F